MTSPADRDLLSRAARALRDDGAAEPPAADESWRAMDGWRHVNQDVRRRARRRRLGLIVALQLFAAVLGVGSWAAVSGRLPPLLSRWVPLARRAAPPPARVHLARVHQQTAGPATPAVAPPPPPAALPPPPAPVVARPVAPPRASRAAVERPQVPGAEDLYARAHRAQFVSHDYAAALALWDEYLATTGASLGLEARWNRAIALVRLGQRDAAIAALRLFAAGENDGYRQEEARALLRVLGAP